MKYHFNKRIYNAFTVIFLALFLLPQTALAATPTVMATIVPIHSLVASVMQGIGTPELIVPGAQSPHAFTLKPSQAKAIAQADLIFYTSHELERFLEAPLKNLAQKNAGVELATSPGLKTYPPSDTPTLEEEYEQLAGEHEEEHHHHDTAIDPHLWLDPRNGVAMALKIADTLSDRDPEHALQYQRNADVLISSLRTFDKKLEQEFAVANTKLPPHTIAFVPFHGAYQYLEKRYSLNPAPYLTQNPETGVTAHDVHALDKMKTTEKINCVFSEPAFDAAIVQRLAEKYKAKVIVLNPDGSLLPPGPEAYQALLTTVTTAMIGCMH